MVVMDEREQIRAADERLSKRLEQSSGTGGSRADQGVRPTLAAANFFGLEELELALTPLPRLDLRELALGVDAPHVSTRPSMLFM